MLMGVYFAKLVDVKCLLDVKELSFATNLPQGLASGTRCFSEIMSIRN
jgi:hypothetical protein